MPTLHDIAAEASRRNAAAMSAAQARYDDMAPDDDDLAEHDEAPVRPAPKPLIDAAALIAECEQTAQAYREKVGADAVAALLFEAGLLRALVRTAAAQVEELRRELQMACDETCNAYHAAGHMQRVQRLYGITEAASA